MVAKTTGTGLSGGVWLTLHNPAVCAQACMWLMTGTEFASVHSESFDLCHDFLKVWGIGRMQWKLSSHAQPAGLTQRNGLYLSEAIRISRFDNWQPERWRKQDNPLLSVRHWHNTVLKHAQMQLLI